MERRFKSFIDRVSAYMDETVQAPKCKKILVGVSGGIDSVVLLHVLINLGYDCEVAHLNYQLRGRESDEDEVFVSDLCKQHGLKFHAFQSPIKHMVDQSDRSVQMVAREVRYSKFADTAVEQGISVVAVGHHGDDQSESLLINLNRGTGPEGIAGMRPKRRLNDQVDLIRPLLMENRASILDYAEMCNLKWREDSSNQDDRYLRSQLRAHVMPHLNSVSLARSSYLMRQWVDQVIRPMIDQNFAYASEGESINIDYLRDLPPVLAHRLVLEGVRQWIPKASVNEDLINRVMDLIDLKTGKRIEVGGGVIWRERNRLVFLDSIDDSIVEESKLGPENGAVMLAGSEVHLYVTTSTPVQLSISEGVWLDADKLHFPLTVRTWLPGDRIQPLGMKGTKKVSDVLTDLAVPVSQRDSVLVVCSQGIIVWVIGHRMAHQFRITNSTKKYAKLYFYRL